MREEIKKLLAWKINKFCALNNDTTTAYNYINMHVFSRIYSLLEQAEDFFFEKDYVETEWKDMVSLHYVNTVYKCDNRVARIHFFTKECCENDKNLENSVIIDCSEKDYLGYITIRPISEPMIILSFICPNFDVYSHFSDALILNYEKKVHINHKEFKIHTFPHFSQDGIAAVCVNADLIMMTNYLHEKYNYRKLRLVDINSDDKWLYPNDGFSTNEILNVAIKNRIPLRILQKRPDTKEMIKSYVLSGLPILLTSNNNEHIIIVVGIDFKENDYKFIIYDDSGAFFSFKKEMDDGNKFEVIEDENKKYHFANSVEWSKIEYWLSSEDDSNDINKDCIIIPLYERVVLSYDEVKEMYREYLNTLFGTTIKNDDKFEEFFNSVSENIRIYNASNFKNFINDNISYVADEGSEIELRSFLKDYSEHFVWVCYGSYKDYNFLLLFNPTTYVLSKSFLPYISFLKSDFIDKLNLYLDVGVIYGNK